MRLHHQLIAIFHLVSAGAQEPNQADIADIIAKWESAAVFTYSERRNSDPIFKKMLFGVKSNSAELNAKIFHKMAKIVKSDHDSEFLVVEFPSEIPDGGQKNVVKLGASFFRIANPDRTIFLSEQFPKISIAQIMEAHARRKMYKK